MSIHVMICYARSGGTILNQCLGCLPKVVILSEVNPLGGGANGGPRKLTTVKSQAEAWYGIRLRAAEDDFAGCVLELEETCARDGRVLVLRDWPWVNFMPVPENGFQPPRRLLTLSALDGRTRLIPFALVRDAIDVYLSSVKFATLARISLSTFAESYLAYVKSLKAARIPLFKYEDFTNDPESVLKTLCRTVGLPFGPEYKQFSSFRTVNGDLQFGPASRGLRLADIRPLARRRIPAAEIRKIDGCRPLGRANSELGYAPTYAGMNRVSRPAEMIDQIVFALHMLKVRIREGLEEKR